MLSFKQLGGLSFIITLSILFGRYLLESKDYRISSLLTEVVNFLDVLEGTLQRAKTLGEEDPYDDLLTKTNEIYERIFEDPEILETTAKKEIADIDKQYQVIVAGKKDEIKALSVDYKRALEGLDTVFDDKSLYILEKIGIFLSDPPELLDPTTVSLESIKDKFTTLAGQFVKLEILQEKQLTGNDEKENDELKNEISKLIKETEDVIKRGAEHYRLLMPKIGKKWKDLEDMVSNIGQHQSQVKTKYKEVRQRINELKYPNKNDEL